MREEEMEEKHKVEHGERKEEENDDALRNNIHKGREGQIENERMTEKRWRERVF